MTNINEETISVVPLHQHPELMKPCCDLINEEWPRSETARMLSLKASCDKLPTSLVLLTEEKKVIGHVKLTPIPSIKESCFVESVVISRALRGRGLGTFLMNASEQYCRSVLSLTTVHLSTKGQEQFYEKLGYVECEPISIYGVFHQKNGFFLNKCSSKENTKTKGPAPPPLPPQKKEHTKTPKTYMVKSILSLKK